MIPERGLAKMKKKIITMLGIIIALFVMACGKQGNLDTGIYIEENETENYQNGNVTGKSIFDNSLAGEWRWKSI